MSHPRTPADLAAWLAEQGIAARLIEEIGDTPTVPAAAQALGVEPDRIVKTLLFLVHTPGDREAAPQPVVVLSNGERRVEKRALAVHFGVGKKQIKLAAPSVVVAETGYPAGGVPPFGHTHQHPLLVDRSIVDFGGPVVVYAGGGDEHTMLEVRVDELLRVTQPAAILPLST